MTLKPTNLQNETLSRLKRDLQLELDALCAQIFNPDSLDFPLLQHDSSVLPPLQLKDNTHYSHGKKEVV